MKKKLKPKSEESPIWNLPCVIISEIFALLPTKSILSCKCVCKFWCSIIRNPEFIGSSQSITLIARRAGDNRGNKNLHLIEPEIDYTLRIRFGLKCLVLGDNSIIKFNDNGFDDFHVKSMEIVNSCKGLVCLTVGDFEFRRNRNLSVDLEWEPFFVCNPVTSDYVVVKQPIPVAPERGWYVHTNGGLGFSSKSNQYKLIRFYSFRKTFNDRGPYLAEAYTLGTVGSDEKWRKLDNGLPRGYSSGDKGVFFEGSLHWIFENCKTTADRIAYKSKHKCQIAAFDCDEETFVFVDLPCGLSRGRMLRHRPHMDLGVLQSRLYFCVSNVRLNFRKSKCHIWVMDEYGVKESWRKLFVVSLGESPDFLMPFKPLAYLKNGEILMLSLNKELVSYDAKSNSWREIKVRGVTSEVEAFLFDPTFLPTKNVLSE